MRSNLDRTLALCVALGACMAAAGLAAGFTSARSEAIAHVDEQLSVEARRERSDVEDYFERSRSIMLIAAQNPSFSQIYAPGGSREQRISGGPRSPR